MEGKKSVIDKILHSYCAYRTKLSGRQKRAALLVIRFSALLGGKLFPPGWESGSATIIG